MTDVTDRLLYARVLNDLRSRIASGNLPVGDSIPSTAKLVQQYEVSTTVVRRAVETLKTEGVLLGQPGKGVYVIAKPEDVATEHHSLESLAHQVGDLRIEVRELSERIDSGHRVEKLTAQVAELRATVEQLYARLGHSYPASDTGTSKSRHHSTGT